MLASILLAKGVGSLCEETQPKQSAARREPRLGLQQCGLDLLTLQCDCVDKLNNNCFDKLKSLTSAALVMSAARRKFVECGHRHSSEHLFNLLKTMRLKFEHKTKFVIGYRIAGC